MDFNLGELLIKHFNGEAAPEEERLVSEWLNRSPDNKIFYDSFSDTEIILQKLEIFNSIRTSDGWQRMQNTIGPLHEENHEAVPPKRALRKYFVGMPLLLRYAAAIIIIAGAIFFFRDSSPKTQVSTTTSSTIKEEIPPGGNKAILKLADGSTIELNNSVNGQLARQGSVEIVKLSSGQLSYIVKSNIDPGATSATFNTLQTPKGGQYQIILPDGTSVWLNAASSITYPTIFTGRERIVEMNGEAYFEVKKNEKIPFKVKTADGSLIEVLGTHFNVNAYADETSVKISLLEGSVKIGNSQLKPGESLVNGNISKTDVEQDIAWKNGVFNFNHLKLPEVMRQISRWYDVDVRYDEKTADIEFGGKMGRNLTLQQVLRGLEGIDENLHFKLEGRILSVVL